MSLLREILQTYYDVDRTRFPCPYCEGTRSLAVHEREGEQYYKCFRCQRAGRGAYLLRDVLGITLGEARACLGVAGKRAGSSTRSRRHKQHREDVRGMCMDLVEVRRLVALGETTWADLSTCPRGAAVRVRKRLEAYHRHGLKQYTKLLKEETHG